MIALPRDLTPNDLEAIERNDRERWALRWPEHTAGGSGSTGKLIFRWQWLAKTLDDVHPYGIYEYLNDLDCRDSLEDLILHMPRTTRTKIRAYVDEIDRVYESLTEEDGGRWLASRYRKAEQAGELGWWWRRKPLEQQPGW